MIHLTNAMSVLLVHWGLYSHWPSNLLPSASPQEISRKGLGATSDECCTFQHKHGERGVWKQAHILLLSYKNRNGTNDKQCPVTEDSNNWLHNNPTTTHWSTSVSSLCVLTSFSVYHVSIPPTSCASHFYWSKCIYFITFNPAYKQMSKHFYTKSIFCPFWVIL